MIFNALLVLSCIYILFLCYLIFGIAQYKQHKIKSNKSTPPVSVIVAVRNGEDSIAQLLEMLIAQNYSGAMEFVIIDDQSSDNTKEMIERYSATDSRVKYIDSIDGDDALSFKKRALDAGIKSSSNELLLFTDADCRPNKSWIRNTIETLDHNTDYQIGMSYVLKKKTLVSRFQSIDFYFLMKAALSIASLKQPNASSGQNILYKKSVYNSVNGFSMISNCIQGDDTLFLQIVKKNTNANVSANDKGYVIGRTESNWLSFIRQRIRWAGDANIMWRFNFLFYTMMVCVFFYSFLLVVSGIYALYNHSMWNTLFLSITMKFILEYLFLLTNNSHPQKFSILDFLFWFFIQPFYIVFVGLGSFVANQIPWRGRVM